ncbi:hypothetical protein L6452_38837 [Arctium lappa]|uniref:Uncharacterized protein n=1 Tax=Arctium lappa TaxID=4217 RepID=A0ACB8XRU3_ARCLA|nr:hypothetical protein L6452_38837 [Arctium lappa]
MVLRPPLVHDLLWLGRHSLYFSQLCGPMAFKGGDEVFVLTIVASVFYDSAGCYIRLVSGRPTGLATGACVFCRTTSKRGWLSNR